MFTDMCPFSWIQKEKGHPTLYNAIRHACNINELRDCMVISRGCFYVVYSPESIRGILSGKNISGLQQLRCCQCSCSCKTAMVCNKPLSAEDLWYIDQTPVGSHVFTGITPSLGLQLHGHFRPIPSGWEQVQPIVGLQNYNPKMFSKANERFKRCRVRGLSIVTKSIAYSSYCLSVAPYTCSYAGFCQSDIDHFQREATKLLLGRPWIKKELMCHVLRWFKVSAPIDPVVAFTVSVLGFYLRKGGKLTAINNIDPSTCDRHSLTVLNVWTSISNLVDPFTLWSAVVDQNTLYEFTSYEKVCSSFKSAILQKYNNLAEDYIRERIMHSWVGGVSFEWARSLSKIPKKRIHGVARFAVLRWAFHEDDDLGLKIRIQQKKSSLNQSCAVCSTHSRTYPFGFSFKPLCEACIRRDELSACKVSSALFQQLNTPCLQDKFGIFVEDCEAVCSLPCKVRSTLFLTNDVPCCIACGQGDNSVAHWCRWCPIPVIVANYLLGDSCGVTSLDQCARQSSDACVIATHVLHQYRRLLIERGAFQHQEPNTDFAPANWVKTLTINTIDALPFNWLHDPWPFELSSKRFSSGGNEGCRIHTEGVKLMPITPLTLLSAQWNEVICTASCTLNKGSEIATIEAGHPIILLCKCPSKFETVTPNAILQKTRCNCKNHHYTIVAKRDICVGEAISYSCFTDKTHILAQFDGSAKLGVGGAGLAVYVINSSGTRLIHWQAIVIPDCQDNVIAESTAARETVLFLNQFLRDTGNDIMLSDIDGITIQGDILPVIKYLRYEGGLKRKDLVPILECARVCASRLPVPHRWTHAPREANGFADHLAGEARKLAVRRLEENKPLQYMVCCKVKLPVELALSNGALVGCLNHVVGVRKIVFHEVTNIPASKLNFALRFYPKFKEAVFRYCQHTGGIGFPNIVYYGTKAADMKGRVYSDRFCGQNLPKIVRLFLFGRSHVEVDIVGAHYELMRRYACKLLPDEGNELPNIYDLRNYLSVTFGVRVDDPNVKTWPLRILNSCADTGLKFSSNILGLPPPSHLVRMARLIENVSRKTCDIICQSRAMHRGEPQNSFFRCFEVIEFEIMYSFYEKLAASVEVSSLIWLHDGVWVSPPPPVQTIRNIEKCLVEELGTGDSFDLFRIQDLKQSWDQQFCLCGNDRSAFQLPSPCKVSVDQLLNLSSDIKWSPCFPPRPSLLVAAEKTFWKRKPPK